jgi:hypothetical protein
MDKRHLAIHKDKVDRVVMLMFQEVLKTFLPVFDERDLVALEVLLENRSVEAIVFGAEDTVERARCWS